MVFASLHMSYSHRFCTAAEAAANGDVPATTSKVGVG
jgi:hypothetical protein